MHEHGRRGDELRVQRTIHQEPFHLPSINYSCVGLEESYGASRVASPFLPAFSPRRVSGSSARKGQVDHLVLPPDSYVILEAERPGVVTPLAQQRSSGSSWEADGLLLQLPRCPPYLTSVGDTRPGPGNWATGHPE